MTAQRMKTTQGLHVTDIQLVNNVNGLFVKNDHGWIYIVLVKATLSILSESTQSPFVSFYHLL